MMAMKTKAAPLPEPDPVPLEPNAAALRVAMLAMHRNQLERRGDVWVGWNDDEHQHAIIQTLRDRGMAYAADGEAWLTAAGRALASKFPETQMRVPEEVLREMRRAAKPQRNSVMPARRERNGRRQRATVDHLNAMAAAERLREQKTVLDQPHRRGETSPLASSALGRLCLRYKLKPELFRAGEGYASIVACWRAAKGIPVAISRAQAGSGPGPSDADVRRWQAAMMAIERAVMREGAEALCALRTIALDEEDVGVAHEPYAIIGLTAAAVELGLCRANEGPYLTSVGDAA